MALSLGGGLCHLALPRHHIKHLISCHQLCLDIAVYSQATADCRVRFDVSLTGMFLSGQAGAGKLSDKHGLLASVGKSDSGLRARLCCCIKH